MNSALRSFLFATIAILLCLGLAWMFLKSRAVTEGPSKPFTNSFFKADEKFITVVDATDLDQKSVEKLPTTTIVWVDVQVTRDKNVVVSSKHDFANPNFNENEKNKTPETGLKSLTARYLNWFDLQKANPDVRLFNDFLSNKDRRFVINVVDYAPGADVVLSDFVTNLKLDERIILQSELDGMLSDLRKLKPMWLYGTSRAQIVQTLWLAGLGLQELSPLKGDVLISPLYTQDTNQKTLLITPDLVNEAHRRSMKVLIGPASQDEVSEIKKLNVDGVVTHATL